MKKRLLASLLTLPLLASCSGFPVSKEESLSILSTIENGVEESSKTSYTQTTVTKTITEVTNKGVKEKIETVTTSLNIYSKESKFFHTYTFATPESLHITESWKFVKSYTYKPSDGEEEITEDFIFDVARVISENSLKQDLEKQYVVTFEKYSDSTWEKYASDYEGRLSRRFSDAIEHSRTLLADETNTLDLKSFNGSSLYLNCKQETEGTTRQSTEYELNVSNNQLISIKTVTAEKTSTETTFEYSVNDISYPSFKVKIV